MELDISNRDNHLQIFWINQSKAPALLATRAATTILHLTQGLGSWQAVTILKEASCKEVSTKPDRLRYQMFFNMEHSSPQWIRQTKITSSISSNSFHLSTAPFQVLKATIRILLIEAEHLKLRLLPFHIWLLGQSRWLHHKAPKVCLCLRRTSIRASSSIRLSMKTQ